jgi:hypothetical protein
MRECPFAGCGKPIPPAMFACAKHWRCVPRDQQRVIYKAYDDYTADKIDVEELRRIQQGVLDQVAPGSTA